MTVSAFGVDHPELVSKKTSNGKKAERATLGAGGGTLAYVGAKHALGHAAYRRNIKTFADSHNGGATMRGTLHGLGEVGMLQHDRKAIAAGGALLAGGAALHYANSRKAKSTVVKSAFGIDHDDVSKKEHKPSSGNASAGRYVTGAIFPGFHGLIAGRKAKGKLKSAGLEVGGAIVGSTLPGPGTLAGGALATHVGNRQGWYKAQSTGVKKSAFDVEHDDIAKYKDEPAINNYIRPKGERKAVRRSAGMWAGAAGAGLGVTGALEAARHEGGAKVAIPLMGAATASSVAGNVAAHRKANKWRAQNDLAPRNFWSGRPDHSRPH